MEIRELGTTDVVLSRKLCRNEIKNNVRTFVKIMSALTALVAIWRINTFFRK
ncbi:MAG: hypothetical protein LBQ66_00780 [Planctomycetaceae bacterium]|jgi:hypothetical protein|nr:hypothetical protein [Planctomycetaceae bacterium]